MRSARALGRPEHRHGDAARPADELRDKWVGRGGVEILRRADLLQPAFSQHRNAIAEIERLVLFMGDQQRGDSYPADQLANLAPGSLPK